MPRRFAVVFCPSLKEKDALDFDDIFGESFDEVVLT